MTSDSLDRNVKMLGIAAGLRGVGHPATDSAADLFLDRIDFDEIFGHQKESVRLLQETKSLAFTDALRDRLPYSEWNLGWELFDVLRRISAIRTDLLLDGLNSLKRSGIEVLAYKGLDMRFGYANRSPERFIMDADPIIHKADLSRVYEVLYAEGFTHGSVDRKSWNDARTGPRISPLDAADVQWVEANHHETHPLFKFAAPAWLRARADLLSELTTITILDNQPIIEIMVDVHHSVAAGFDEQDVWREPRDITMPKVGSIKATSGAVNLAVFLGRLYSVTHVFHDTPIHCIYDAARVCTASVDWQEYFRLVDKYRLFGSAFYGLAFLDEITNNLLIPNEVVEQARLRLASHRQFDLGDFVGKAMTLPPVSNAGLIRNVALDRKPK